MNKYINNRVLEMYTHHKQREKNWIQKNLKLIGIKLLSTTVRRLRKFPYDSLSIWYGSSLDNSFYTYAHKQLGHLHTLIWHIVLIFSNTSQVVQHSSKLFKVSHLNNVYPLQYFQLQKEQHKIHLP